MNGCSPTQFYPLHSKHAAVIIATYLVVLGNPDNYYSLWAPTSSFYNTYKTHYLDNQNDSPLGSTSDNSPSTLHQSTASIGDTSKLEYTTQVVEESFKHETGPQGWPQGPFLIQPTYRRGIGNAVAECELVPGLSTLKSSNCELAY
jgi:hypothetical protein